MNFGTIQVANIFVGTLNAIEAYFGTEKIWGKSEPSTANWLCFTAEEANSTLHLDKNGSPNAISLETSTDGNTWTDYTWSGNTGTTLTLANISDKVYMRAKTENQIIGSSSSNYYKFVMTGKIAASGNIQTLLKADGSRTDAPSYCYANMFSGCTSLTTAPELPATTLAEGCYNGMFSSCKSLTQAPELPATTLADSCYQNMFSFCSALTQAPALPATTLANNCYQNMFSFCKSLTQAPALPATTLANKCYIRMFQSCKSLTQAPELPATTLDDSCYEFMFRDCTSLTTAPELPATTLAEGCYDHMFEGCTSLTNAPEILPATTLAANCYNGMFKGCSSLTTAQELPATTLANFCYAVMFYGCSKLNTIKLGYTGNFADAPSNAFSNWVSGVASTGTFYYNGSDTTTGVSAIPSGWTVVKDSQEPSALCFTAEEANSTVAMTAKGSAPTVSLEYSTNGNTWNPFVVGTTTVTLANIGDKMYMRATSAGNTRMGSSKSNYNYFVMTGKISASGNLNTLLDQNGNATLTQNCYNYMFNNCTSLTTAPELPATTLADWCYGSMFRGCTSLSTAPELPATRLANSCYTSMFNGCSSLTSAPELPATTLAEGCYRSIFSYCKSLTTAPELPATRLANSCYTSMFYNCSNLNTIKLGYTGNFADAPTDAFSSWVNGVASTGTFYYNGSDTTTGTSAIPRGWTVTPFTS